MPFLLNKMPVRAFLSKIKLNEVFLILQRSPRIIRAIRKIEIKNPPIDQLDWLYDAFDRCL